jgi:hypothetical protein
MADTEAKPAPAAAVEVVEVKPVVEKEKEKDVVVAEVKETVIKEPVVAPAPEVVVVADDSSKASAKTFTTHSGETVTVIEHPDVNHHEEQLATVPVVEETSHASAEIIKPATVTTAAVVVPAAAIAAEEIKPAIQKAPTLVVIPPTAVAEEQKTTKGVVIDAVVATPPLKAKSVVESPVTEKPLPILRPATIHQDVNIPAPPSPPELDALLEPVGIFSDYIAKSETILFMQQNMAGAEAEQDHVVIDETGTAVSTPEALPIHS